MIKAQLKKEQKREEQMQRAQSAILRPGERFARPFKSALSNVDQIGTRPSTVNQNEPRLLASTPYQPNDRRPFTAPAGLRVTPVRSASPTKSPGYCYGASLKHLAVLNGLEIPFI